MKKTKAAYFEKNMEEVKKKIIRDSITAMDSKFSDGDMKKFMLLDKAGQKSFVTSAFSGQENRRK